MSQAITHVDELYDDSSNSNRYNEFKVARVREMVPAIGLEPREFPARVGDHYQIEDNNGVVTTGTHTAETIEGATTKVNQWNVQCQEEGTKNGKGEIVPGKMLKRALVLETAITPKLLAKAVEGTIADTKVLLTYRCRVLDKDTTSAHIATGETEPRVYSAGSIFKNLGRIDPIVSAPIFVQAESVHE